MPTILTHATIPLAAGIGLGKRVISRRLLYAGVVASILPDLDVLAFRFGISYTDNFGHRGLTHSLLFAVFVALVAMLFTRRLDSTRLKIFLFMVICAASHPILDMFTNGGKGVALFWPFFDERLFAPWRMIEVSPIGFRFFSDRGIDVLQSEFVWVWLPAILICSALIIYRCMKINGSGRKQA